MIKPDPTVRRALSPSIRQGPSPGRVTAVIPPHSISASRAAAGLKSGSGTQQATPARPIATVVDEEQLHRRFMQSVSDKRLKSTLAIKNGGGRQQQERLQPQRGTPIGKTVPTDGGTVQRLAKSVPCSEHSHSHSHSTSSSRSDRSLTGSMTASGNTMNPNESRTGNYGTANTTGFKLADDLSRSPPPAAIIIPPSVARSLSLKAAKDSARSKSPESRSITREQLDYGPLLKSNEVQVLYRSPESIEASASSLGWCLLF